MHSVCVCTLVIAELGLGSTGTKPDNLAFAKVQQMGAADSLKLFSEGLYTTSSLPEKPLFSSFYLLFLMKMFFPLFPIGKAGQLEEEHRIYVWPWPFCQTHSKDWGTSGHQPGPKQGGTYDHGQQRELPDTQHTQVIQLLNVTRVSLSRTGSSMYLLEARRGQTPGSKRIWSHTHHCVFSI